MSSNTCPPGMGTRVKPGAGGKLREIVERLADDAHNRANLTLAQLVEASGMIKE